MGDFIIPTISQIGETITGKTPSSESPGDFGSATPFVTPSDSFDQKFITRTERSLSAAGVAKLRGKLLPPNSVLVTCIGSAMGKVAMCKVASISNQQINSIVVRDDYSADYIYYTLTNNYRVLRNAATGSTALPLLNKGDFDALKFRIHSNKAEQQKIAAVLSALDAKIDLNQRINAELEALAKTIYDYWFVQFDFPDAHGRPYKSSGGAMAWSDTLKREIPAGWKVQPLSAWIAKQKSGEWGADRASGDNEAQVTCIRGADINALNGRGELKAPTRYVPPSKMEKYLAPYDLVVEISGGSPTQSTGRAALVGPEVVARFDVPLVCSNFCKALTLNDATQAYHFLQQWNALYGAGVFFGWEGKTSGIKNLQFDAFVDNYHAPMPPDALLRHFHALCSSLDQRKQNGLRENAELARLRDWLLPLLMNGQVRVAGDAS